MPDFRAYCTPPPDQSAEITLSPEESHHLVAVNRARCGDPIVAFDGCGTEWLCALSSAHKNGAVLSIRSKRRLPALPYEITLAQALPKGGTMDAIVRKATEIGAAQIIPPRERAHSGPPRRRSLRKENREMADRRARSREAVRQRVRPCGAAHPISRGLDSEFRRLRLETRRQSRPRRSIPQTRLDGFCCHARSAAKKSSLARRPRGRFFSDRAERRSAPRV